MKKQQKTSPGRRASRQWSRTSFPFAFAFRHSFRRRRRCREALSFYLLLIGRPSLCITGKRKRTDAGPKKQTQTHPGMHGNKGTALPGGRQKKQNPLATPVCPTRGGCWVEGKGLRAGRYKQAQTCPARCPLPGRIDAPPYKVWPESRHLTTQNVASRGGFTNLHSKERYIGNFVRKITKNARVFVHETVAAPTIIASPKKHRTSHGNIGLQKV